MYVHKNDEMRTPRARGSCVSRDPQFPQVLGAPLTRACIRPIAASWGRPQGGGPPVLGISAAQQCLGLPVPRAGLFPDLRPERGCGGSHGCALQGTMLGQPTRRVHVQAHPRQSLLP